MGFNKDPLNRSLFKWLQAETDGGLKEGAERSCARCQSERDARNEADGKVGGDQGEIVLEARRDRRRSPAGGVGLGGEPTVKARALCPGSPGLFWSAPTSLPGWGN
jgi:hypothetical protein